MARPEEDDELKEARGTNRADRQRKIVEITPIPERRYAPKELIDDRAKDEYRRCVKQLSEDGTGADVDESLLVAYCNSIARWFTLSEEVAEIEESGQEVSKGVYNQVNNHLKNAVKLAEMFGITPAARGKIKPSKKKKAEDPTAEAFKDLIKKTA